MSSFNSAIGGFAVRVPGYSHGGQGRGRLRAFGGEGGEGRGGRIDNRFGRGLDRSSRTYRSDGVRGPERRGPVERTQRPDAVERTRSKSISESSTLSLTVTTAEGDTVELSIEAQSLRQSEKTYTREESGVTRTRSKSKEESVSASVSVEGDLSDEELADIQELLTAIGTGGQVDFSEVESLSSYDYSLARSREVSFNVSTVAVYA